MKMSKKVLVLTASLMIVSSLFAATVLAVTPNGNPFQELWKAIAGLQEQINNIQLPATTLLTVDDEHNTAFDLRWVDVTEQVKNVAHVTLTPPENGRVLITVTACWDNHNWNHQQVTLGISDVSPESKDFLYLTQAYCFLSGPPNMLSVQVPMTAQTVVEVSKGTTVNYYANAYVFYSGHYDTLHYVIMTAVFYPA